MIGSIRRECLDHIVVFGDAQLRRILGAYIGLQRTPNVSVVGQGFAEPSARSTTRSRHRADDSRRTSSSILPDVVFGRHKGSVGYFWPRLDGFILDEELAGDLNAQRVPLHGRYRRSPPLRDHREQAETAARTNLSSRCRQVGCCGRPEHRLPRPTAISLSFNITPATTWSRRGVGTGRVEEPRITEVRSKSMDGAFDRRLAEFLVERAMLSL